MVQSRRTTLSAELANHGEIPGGVWTAMSKDKKPRDLIHRLRIPNTHLPQYEHDTRRMAKLTRNDHEKLQLNDLEDHNQAIRKIHKNLNST